MLQCKVSIYNQWIVIHSVVYTLYHNSPVVRCLYTTSAIYNKWIVICGVFCCIYITGVNKSPSPTPGASNFHIWSSWNNQLYARRASKNIYLILTNLSIFAYLLIFIYVICLIRSNVLFIQPLAFYRNWEQRR